MNSRKRTKTAPKTADALEGRPLCDHLARTLFATRNEDVRLIDLRGLSDVADWFLVATCTSEPQMQASLSALERDSKAVGVRPLGIEYRAGARWAVLDIGEVMVHLFETQAREEYSLERLWRDGKQEVLSEKDYPTIAGLEEDGNALL